MKITYSRLLLHIKLKSKFLVCVYDLYTTLFFILSNMQSTFEGTKLFLIIIYNIFNGAKTKSFKMNDNKMLEIGYIKMNIKWDKL